MGIAVVAGRATETNLALATALRGPLLTPAEAVERLGLGDVALARLDVLPTLDGVEPGLPELRRMRDVGVQLLNEPDALLAAHDKLLTARLLTAARIPHPRTVHVGDRGPSTWLEPPVVLKPRFGSWGADVVLCSTEAAFESALTDLRAREWFKRGGALAQELVPPLGHDLRLVVAAGRVVGAIQRVAAAGEWRTNVALGAQRVTAVPPASARRLAMAAAAVTGCELVGIDLLPLAEGGWVVLEINGAVEFNAEYSLGTRNVVAAAADALLASLPVREPVSGAALG